MEGKPYYELTVDDMRDALARKQGEVEELYRKLAAPQSPWRYLIDAAGEDTGEEAPHNVPVWLSQRFRDGRTRTIEGTRRKNGFNDETPLYETRSGYLEGDEVYAFALIEKPDPAPYPGGE